ncbi:MULTISPECIES: preprotein translocase subunit SecE [unclassified Microbacterium]|uniref:preprotein translocase subunit SecE n=1 Tax=unclassified Microbacterium TaxID=2609290 RepID=UPI00214AFAD3|nr:MULTISPECIES: preprotein translocase subunit SecE [unclassified Microbacterium]MCR2783808.1 preprotein translocase subunit SecE [Microbacterium sp. zg.B96]MDL5351400.1 preprotein translocase subunit SecE [Microbacterium sp. zg-YB36]WIM15342.1 preprotein translocase subunit SecE [Microbacterium sp. zg-B96]
MVQDESKGEVVETGDAPRVAPSDTPRSKKPNFFQRIANFFRRIANFFREVFAELRKVVTPTRQELLKFTGVVLGFVVVMMAIVYGLDWVFTWVVQIVFGVPS